ncbi:hypothetical protein [Aureibacillus halotolerans]|uniref:ParB-like nuclease family protein n=1 Tax=Aureibacillus halotolerans TaxID=1508390 RepID=A0A4R6U5S8_9BACI|nr:hypothetical protein [Aureibacillus halotolerans]TDQ38394.1 hypothetical protein EV213_110141 [Aureibacillus halotolerans]
MSDKRLYKLVNVSSILNYSENPRHDIGTNEIDTIKKLINKVGSQYMYNLASDILVNGLLGANLPTLVYSSEKKKYIVYEGNRRVACIKFLNDPSILTTIDKSLKQRIEKLRKTEKTVYSSDIYCLITDEDEAFTIMERNHSGEDKGRGPKAWTSKEKAIFKNRIKHKITIELVIAELFERHFNVDVTKKISYTTIQRFFNNREIKKVLDINSDFKNISKEKLVLINYLIDKAIEESAKRKVTLTRLFNRAREIEDFFVPLIEDYQLSRGPKDNQEDKETTENTDENGGNNVVVQHEISSNTSSEGDAIETNEHESEVLVKFNLLKSINKFYFTDQTINLLENLEITNKEVYTAELLDIDCSGLKVENGIIQPNNLPGEYKVIYRYYLDSFKKVICWQDSMTITLKSKKLSLPMQQTVLSSTFTVKYHEMLQFENGDKLRALMVFLSNESKHGKYSNILNIVSRMFLEYSFRMYASKVLNNDNQTIDKISQNLKGFIDHCCNKIEQENPNKFVKHIQRGRKDATNKIDILQKSIHYFDVSISNEDIQIMFTNLNIYLEHVYDGIIKETIHNAN